MKKYILLLATLFFNLLSAQTLFTEDFSNYPLGNFNNDFTGTTPNQGGWYTFDAGRAPYFYSSTNADYQIVTDSNQNKYLYLDYTKQSVSNQHWVFRNDIKNIWQQRSAGNNIIKFSFDIFTQEANDQSAVVYLQNAGGNLFALQYLGKNRYFSLQFPRLRNKLGGLGELRYDNQALVVLPVNTWVTIEMYLDWDTSEVAIRIPVLNYTNKGQIGYPFMFGGLDNEGNPLPDDTLTKVTFLGAGGISNNPNLKNPFRLRVDNITISAQNTMPAVNILNTKKYLSNSFNLYPNPATTFVTITNNENKQLQQIRVYDVTGKLISSYTYNNETEIQLNVENLASGTYMLHLETVEGTAIKKFIKK